MPQLVVLLLLICGSSLSAQELLHTQTSGFVYNENGRFPFSVEANLIPFDKSIHKLSYIGCDGGIPSFVCSSFSITLNKSEIKIPKEAYSDLADITSVGIPNSEFENNLWTITIEGGSAGGSYQAELKFNDKQIVQRRFVDLFSPIKERKYYNTKKY